MRLLLFLILLLSALSSDCSRAQIEEVLDRGRVGAADPNSILANKPTEALLEQISTAYQRYGLPLTWGYEGPKVITEPLNAAALLSEAKRNALVDREISALRRAAPAGRPAEVYFDDYTAPLLCYRLGWKLAAIDILKRKLTDYHWDCIEDIAQAAWRHWENSLTGSKTDRAVASRYLHLIFEDYPALRTNHKRYLIDDLDYTLAHTGKRCDGIEGEIDDICSESSEPIDVMAAWYSGTHKSNKAADALYLLGFEAVPALMTHISDRRLTRCAMVGVERYPGHIARVGEICSMLLRDLAGRSNITSGLVFTLEQELVDENKTAEWWKVASCQTEQQYLVNNVQPESDGVQYRPQMGNINLLAAKYPDRLPEVYEKLITRFPHVQSEQIAFLVADHKSKSTEMLPRLVQLADSGGTDQSLGALYALMGIKYAGTVGLLTARLDSLPAKPVTGYRRAEAGGLVHVVVSLNDDGAYAALARLLRRSIPCQKLDIIGACVDEIYLNGSQKYHVIHMLADYIHDRSVCDLRHGEVYEAPRVFSPIGMDHIKLGDAALFAIATQLGIITSDQGRWNVALWNSCRKSAKAGLAKYLEQEDSVADP